jgi:hypothetical protein
MAYTMPDIGGRSSGRTSFILPVMAGLAPAIHVFGVLSAAKLWMPGIKPGMTRKGSAVAESGFGERGD